MRILIQPEPAQWALWQRSGDMAPTTATGHQALMYHPGILAKDIAAAEAAKATGGRCFHLVVDHDVHDCLSLDVPVADGERLRVHTLNLGRQRLDVPVGAQPAVAVRDALAAIDRTVESFGRKLCVDLSPLRAAWAEAPESHISLARQMAHVLATLKQPWTGQMSVVYATSLSQWPCFAELVDRMLHDPVNCARRYNDAAAAHPEAGLTPLSIETDRCELPLWAVQRGAMRQRIYAKTHAGPPHLTDERGQAVPTEPPSADEDAFAAGNVQLAPRAITMTALLRRHLCDLFIHGTGGGVYDRVADAWFEQWAGEPLEPFAVVSADLYLPFEQPVRQPSERSRWKWRLHHLRHNVDRELGLDEDEPLVAEKRQLLATMNVDRDRHRRRAAFDRIHAINAELAQLHPGPIEQAERELHQCEVGIHNAAVARRRDWCFALYPPDSLNALHRAICERIAPSRATAGPDRAGAQRRW